MPTATRDILIRNRLGLHARPAMQFAELANAFTSSVRVRRLGAAPVEADGKSVMQMLVLEAAEGTTLRITAQGADAETAVARLAALVESRFGEAE
jgi:phosphocarrier protein HPr